MRRTGPTSPPARRRAGRGRSSATRSTPWRWRSSTPAWSATTRIVVQLPNCVEQFAVYLACARLGLIVSPVPVQYREHELAQILRLTAAAAVVTFDRIGHAERPHRAARMFAGLRASQPALQHVFAWGGEERGGLRRAGAP